jgi:N utilization substance protein A
MVVNEVRGEKVDIVPYTDDPAEFVMKALAPARVREVRIHPDTGTAEVIVPDFQLSLAIGKEGQNARLAARLSGWRVDIKSETQLAEEEAGGGVEYAEGEWVETDEGRFYRLADGTLVSEAEAGYASPDQAAASGEATVEAEAGLVREETGEAREFDTPDGATPAEEAAMHVEGPEDALASNAELGNPEAAPETENPGEA